MISWLQILTYVSLAIFLLITLGKVRRIASAPLHLRWELYPVPHEKGKPYGGSFFEELNWWAKKREKSLVSELVAMGSEILFLTAVYHHNKKLWYLSYPFHGGLYLSIAFVVLLVVEAIMQVAGSPVALTAPWLHNLTIVLGVAGMVGVGLGSLGLLFRRLFSAELRVYSAPVDYFNLLFLIAIAATGLYAWLRVDPSFVALRSFIQGLITLSPAFPESRSVVAEIALVSLFMLYMPFTHMIHWAAKYFTYHKVRWDDTPNLKETGLEDKILVNLHRKVRWTAPHIEPGKSWAEVATKEVQ